MYINICVYIHTHIYMHIYIHTYILEKGMATHSSIPAWRIPWTEKAGGLQSMGLQIVKHNLVTKQQCTMDYSVQFSRSVVSDSLRPHESQHTRPPCPLPTPGVHSDSRPWLVMPSSHLILWRPLLLLPTIPPSITVFSDESTLQMRWPKYSSFSFSIIPFKEHPGLISFRMDWFDLLAVPGTLKSLLQHHNSKVQFFGAQLSSQSNSRIHTWPLEKP